VGVGSCGHFPPPRVLNAGIGNREIIGWPLSTYLKWKTSLPTRRRAYYYAERVQETAQA
jgi:hypothetical protein